MSKFLHKLFLGNNYIPKTIFELEKTLYLEKSRPFNSKHHLFLTGLPRSGTTILLNLLYRTNYFASLTYEDLPLILSPNLWKIFYRSAAKQQENQLQERAHKDRIRINRQSPEAFDEIFWRTFTGKHYLNKKSLSPYSLPASILKEYDNYISLILYKYQKMHYLSKNNNNILRLASLIKHYPKSLFIVLFRDPIQQADSLLKQHQNFCKIQKEDIFALTYMNYLVHHEFGLNHKPFEFSGFPIGLPKGNIDYWLHVWVGYYQYLLGQDKNDLDQILFLHYETFCNNPDQYINSISGRLSMDLSNMDTQILKASEEKSLMIEDKGLKQCAYDIYHKLQELAV
jgi:hypothetical protein